jgi:serine/threonine protein kinase
MIFKHLFSKKTQSEKASLVKPIEVSLVKSIETSSLVFSLIKTILNRLQTIHSHGVIYNCLTLDSVVLRDRDGKLGFLYCGDISNVIEIKTSQLIDRHITFTCYIDRYKAPEVLAKRAEFSSDIYAVGAIAIQCLVGCSLNKLEECPITGRIKWREFCQVSDLFADILNKMYEPSRRYRYNNVAEVLDAIAKIYS